VEFSDFLKDGRMILLTVPYPLGFYAKGFDGRIDDPNAGWKGRGLWASSGDRAPWLMERGKGSRPLVHFQLRPDPLAMDRACPRIPWWDSEVRGRDG
jgi:hypothetical protein